MIPAGTRTILYLLGSVILITAVTTVLGARDSTSGPWRGTIFPTTNASGRPTIRLYPKLDFFADYHVPAPGIGPHNFSAIFDTVLTLPNDTELLFRLTCDDGARVFIDGEKIIDLWGTHPPLQGSRPFKLSRGRHHLVVSQRQDGYLAGLALEVLEAKSRQPIDPGWFALPAAKAKVPLGFAQ